MPMFPIETNTERVEIRLDFKGDPDGTKRPSRYAEFGITKEQLENMDGITISLNNELLLRLNRFSLKQ